MVVCVPWIRTVCRFAIFTYDHKSWNSCNLFNKVSCLKFLGAGFLVPKHSLRCCENQHVLGPDYGPRFVEP